MGNTHGKRRKRGKGEPQDKDDKGQKDHYGTPVVMLKSVRRKSTLQGGNEAGNTDDEDIRFQNIYSKPITVDSNYKAPVYPKTKEEIRLIHDAVKENFVFSGLGENEANILVHAMESHSISAGSTIIRQGQAVGDYFYVVKQGEVQFYIDGKSVGTGKAGTAFGELSLIYDCPRTATVIAVDDCVLFRVGQEVFRKVLQAHQLSMEGDKLNLLKNVNTFKELRESQLKKVADCMSLMGYKQGDKIVQKGTQGLTFYVVKAGTVKVTDIGLGTSDFEDSELGPGECFGERSLITGDVRDANITASSDCLLYCMSREDFHEVLGAYENVINMNLSATKLMSVPLVAQANLTPDELGQLSSLVEDVSFEKDFVIHNVRDKITPCLYMIRSGRVELTDKAGVVKNITNNDYFGDNSFTTPVGDQFESDHTAKVLVDTECSKLSLTSIALVLPHIAKRLTGKSHRSIRRNSLVEELDLTLIKKIRIIGEGTFGQVWLVSGKQDKKPYALKIQSKRWLLDKGQEVGVMREKMIMNTLDHPFIIRLVNSFQDDQFLYMITNIYLGGELYSIMRTTKSSGMSERRAKFYTACILEALDYMHKKKILYRDLKPENVLIDSDGYCVIIDLGFAKVVPSKTYTLCGTPLYIAPEVILQRGHNKGADLWSFAVLTYELIVGKTPFYSRGMDQAQLFRRICNTNFSVEGKCSKNAADMISRMLVNPPHVRLGCLAKGADDIRHHAWFTGVKFSYIVSKKFKAPWVPTIKNPLDAENFDTISDSEKDKSENGVLKKSEQKAFKDF